MNARRVRRTATVWGVAVAAMLVIAGCGSSPAAAPAASTGGTGAVGATSGVSPMQTRATIQGTQSTVKSSSSPTGAARPSSPSRSAPATTERLASSSESGRRQYAGMNLQAAIDAAERAGVSPEDVGGGDLGIVVARDWTVCFASPSTRSVTFFAAKGCAADSSVAGVSVPPKVVASLVGRNLESDEHELASSKYGYQEIGGGTLGILDPDNWTVCYARRSSSGSAQLFAAKDCTPEPPA